jgi:hypothetical protein
MAGLILGVIFGALGDEGFRSIFGGDHSAALQAKVDELRGDMRLVRGRLYSLARHQFHLEAEVQGLTSLLAVKTEADALISLEHFHQSGETVVRR